MAQTKSEIEGVIKFNTSGHREVDPFSWHLLAELESFRKKLNLKNLIGHDPVLNVGFGNISKREAGNTFFITGSQTGKLHDLNGSHYVKILEVDLDQMGLRSEGPILPSSESISHGVIYHSNANVGAVIHIHNHSLWLASQSEEHEVDLMFTTREAEYGSQLLAEELKNLSAAKDEGIISMLGHQDGLIFFGRNLERSYELLTEFLEKYTKSK